MTNDTIVAARIPSEIKDQGNAILTSLGYTPTQLINSAYRYVLEFGQLPIDSAPIRPGKRQIDQTKLKQISEELRLLQVTNFDYTDCGQKTLKQSLARSLMLDYPDLP